MTLKKWLIFSRDQHSKENAIPRWNKKCKKARLKYSSQAGSLLLCSGQRWRQAVGGKPISAVPYVTPPRPQTTYLFQMSLKVTILEHIWTSQHLLCPWPVIFRAARLSLICSKRAHSWVHRTQSWEVTTALSSYQWRRCSGICKIVNKKLHFSLQSLSHITLSNTSLRYMTSKHRYGTGFILINNNSMRHSLSVHWLLLCLIIRKISAKFMAEIGAKSKEKHLGHFSCGKQDEINAGFVTS